MTRKAHLLRRLGNQGISTTIWRGISLRLRLLDRRSYGRPDEALPRHGQEAARVRRGRSRYSERRGRML